MSETHKIEVQTETEKDQLENYIEPDFTYSVSVEGCASSTGEPPGMGMGPGLV